MPPKPKFDEEKPLVKKYRILKYSEAKERLLSDLREAGKLRE